METMSINTEESSGIEYAKKKMREQKEKMRSDEFKRDIKNRLKSNTLTNNKELKNILYEMFPISELYIENVYIEEFARIYKESECDKDIFIKRFLNIYEEYWYMGLKSDIAILRRELKVKKLNV